MPLAQQVSPMDQHKRAHLAPGDKGGSGDSLAESGGAQRTPTSCLSISSTADF